MPTLANKPADIRPSDDDASTCDLLLDARAVMDQPEEWSLNEVAASAVVLAILGEDEGEKERGHATLRAINLAASAKGFAMRVAADERAQRRWGAENLFSYETLLSALIIVGATYIIIGIIAAVLQRIFL